MAYRRRRRYPKKRYARRTRYVNPYRAAQKVIENTCERKATDSSFVSQYILSAGSVFHVSPISRGTDDSQRNGNFVQARSIAIRFTIEADSGTCLRFILFWDKNAQGSNPGVTDLLSTANYQSFRNLDNKTRFDVIMDKVYNMHNYDVSGGSTHMIIKKYWKKLPHRQVGFDGTSSTPWTNSLHVLLISDIASDAVYVNGKSRFQFLDL